VAVEVLNVRITAETELVLAKAQGLQENTVVEELRTLKIRDRDIDMVDSNYFGHGMALTVSGRANVRVLPRGACGVAASVTRRSTTRC
jgi:hypothetical protein